MDTPIDEELLVTMFVESLGDRSMSSFGAAIHALLTKKDHFSELGTARFLQEHVSQQLSKSANILTNNLAFSS